MPDWVIRFGSARISSTLLFCSALMVAAKSMSGRKIKMFSKSLSPILVTPRPLVVLVNCGGANCCVEMVPTFFDPGKLRMLNPSWLILARFTSANFTCSRISAFGAVGHFHQAGDFWVLFFTTSRILSATAAEEM